MNVDLVFAIFAGFLFFIVLIRNIEQVLKGEPMTRLGLLLAFF